MNVIGEKTWVIRDVLDLCDERRDLKKKWYEAEGAKEYREANKRIQKAVKKEKDRYSVRGDRNLSKQKTTAREHTCW